MLVCRVSKINSTEKFFISFVYGQNKAEQKKPLWAQIKVVSKNMTSDWCILGHFNLVLHRNDRLEGNPREFGEIRDFLKEITSFGASYSWSNIHDLA